MRLHRLPVTRSAPAQKISVATCSHCFCISHQPANARAERVRVPVPVAVDPRLSEQGARDLAVTGTILHGVMDPQHLEPSACLWLAREQRRTEAAMLAKTEKAPERQHAAAGGGEPVQAIMKMDGMLPRQPTAGHIQSDMMPSVRQNGMFEPVCPFNAGKPGRDMREEQAVRVARIRGPGRDRQCAGVESRAPDNPGVRCSKARMFREREAPMRQGPGRRHVWRCSPVCARRRNPGPGAAIPT